MFVFILFLVFYFFFKQKTAYEVRISDWSSDVCSSDLLGAGELDVVLQHGLAGAGAGEADDQRGLEQREVHRRQQHLRQAVEREKADGDAEHLDRLAATAGGQHLADHRDPQQDRKSGQWGKGVSVGVDLGGRRLIQ